MIAERPDATGRTSLGPEIARAFIDRSLDGFFVHDEDGLAEFRPGRLGQFGHRVEHAVP